MSNASPGFIAYITTAKYQDGIPLYRLEGILARYRIELSRTTAANWMIKAGILVTPLFDLLSKTQLAYDVLQMNETTVQILKQDGREADAQSYMWVRRSNEPGKPIVLFDYMPSRAAARCRSAFSTATRATCRPTVTRATTSPARVTA